jgi:hypothetical protein
MPLVVADCWAVKEQPLSGLVFHAGLDKLNFDGIYNWLDLLRQLFLRILTIRMSDDLHNLGFSAATDLAIKTVHQVQTTSDQLPPPTFIADAVSPEVVMVKGRIVGN